MKINNSGFYKLSEINDNEIIVGNNLAITIFDDTKNSYNINIGEESNVEFFGFSENICKNINIIQNNNGTKLHFRYLIHSNIEKESKIKIFSNISNNDNSSDIKILSIIGEKGNINLDGIIKINTGAKDIKGKLIEDNLFLGSKGCIKGIPTLLVESDDVEASHACKIERISDDKLFYMRSRGIGKENAVSMMINAKVFDLFKCLSMINKDFYDKLIENILNKIK